MNLGTQRLNMIECQENFWDLELKENNIKIGHISLSDQNHNIYSLSFKLNIDFSGKGYMSEALCQVLKFGFEKLKAQRIEGICPKNNLAIGVVMSKNHMLYEGFSRCKYIDESGNMIDAYLYGITSGQYFKTLEIGFDELIEKAIEKVGYRSLSPSVSAGSVASAVLSEKGIIYTGVCIDASCSVGFCAEQSALSNMITNGENTVKKIVAVNQRGVIYPPCGRCREFLTQISSKNIDAQVMVERDKVVTLKELIPYNWTEAKGKIGHAIFMESERLELVILSEDMENDIFENFNEEITQFMYPKPPEKIQETRTFINGALRKIQNDEELIYAIKLKSNKEFLGLAGIHNIKSGAPELGIWTKKSAHGNGFGFEAISTLIGHIRMNIPYNHIIYPVAKENWPSRRIPVMHGGKLQKEYTVINQSGKALEILEYRID